MLGFMNTTIKGIFWSKFSPWSNTHPSSMGDQFCRSQTSVVVVTTSYKKKKNTVCCLLIHNKTLIKKAVTGTNNAQNSISTNSANAVVEGQRAVYCYCVVFLHLLRVVLHCAMVC